MGSVESEQPGTTLLNSNNAIDRAQSYLGWLGPIVHDDHSGAKDAIEPMNSEVNVLSNIA